MTYLPGYDNAPSPVTNRVTDGLHITSVEWAAESSQPPSPAKEVEDDVEVQTEPDLHRQDIRDAIHARVIYRTWRSWAFPGSTATTMAGVKDKCPMPSCGQSFIDLSSILLHLEKDCDRVKSWVESECSRAQQAMGVSEPLHPCRGRCPWCRTRSLFDNGKPFNLKRLSIKSLHQSLKKSRKGADIAKDAVHPQLPPPPATSKTSSPPPSSTPPSYEPKQDVVDAIVPVEIHGRPIYHPVEMDSVELPVELHDTGMCPVLGRYVDAAWSGVQDISTKPPRGVSMMSDCTSSSRGRDSLISSYSQPSIPTPSTTLSPLSATTRLESSGPIFADAYTCSPVESSDDGFPPSASDIGLPASGPFDTDAGPFPALPHKEFTFGLPLPSLPSLVTTVPEPHEEVGAQPQNVPAAPVPDVTPSSPPTTPENEMLERLKDTFSQFRKTCFGHNSGRGLIMAGSLSALPDDVPLLGALDSLENALQGKTDEHKIFTFCFAYLAMAMAVASEIREYVPPTFYPALCQDMTRFVEGEGEVVLSERFLSVSKAFLDALQSSTSSSSPSDNGDRGEQDDIMGNRNNRLLESFQKMKTYLRAHPRPRSPPVLPSSRQYSCDSTTSTLVEQEQEPGHVPHSQVPQVEQLLPKDTHDHSHIPSNPFSSTDNPIPCPMVRISRQHPPLTIRIPIQRRYEEQPDTSCKTCDFNPSPPDRKKKVDKHKLTDNHRRREMKLDEDLQAEQVDVGRKGSEVQGVRYACTMVLTDGSACTSTFNRKDNMKQHCKRKHSGEEDDGREVMRRRRGVGR